MTATCNRASDSDELITINSVEFRKFIPCGEPVDDGTSRCIVCGQIDKPEYHDNDLCPATNPRAIAK